MPEQTDRAVVADLLDTAGRTYAEDAGIRLRDKPAALYKLLVLTLLLSARITADIAVTAARELFAAGATTGPKLRDTSRRQVIAALGRGHYVRYDESTATALAATADFLAAKYRGDLRLLAAAADHDPERVAKLLQEFHGIGAVGAEIFLREVQDVWTWVGPQFDSKATDGARRIGLPTGTDELAGLAPRGRRSALAAALVRAALDDDIVREVRRH